MGLSLRVVLIWLMLVAELHAIKSLSKAKDPVFEVQARRQMTLIQPRPQIRPQLTHYVSVPQPESRVQVIHVPQPQVQVLPAPQPQPIPVIVQQPRPVQEQVIVVHPMPVVQKKPPMQPQYHPHPVLQRQPRPVVNRKVIVVQPQPVVQVQPQPQPQHRIVVQPQPAPQSKVVVISPQPAVQAGALGGLGSGYAQGGLGSGYAQGGLGSGYAQGGLGSGYVQPQGVLVSGGAGLGIHGSAYPGSYSVPLVQSHTMVPHYSRPLPQVSINQPRVVASGPSFQATKM